VKRFRGGLVFKAQTFVSLVFKAHRLLHHSYLRLIDFYITEEDLVRESGDARFQGEVRRQERLLARCTLLQLRRATLLLRLCSPAFISGLRGCTVK